MNRGIEQDQGVAFGPGCQPSASAPDGSSQSGIPNAGQLFAQIESFIDMKIAFARMAPEQRRNVLDMMCRGRQRAVAAFASAMSAGTAETAQQAQGQRPASAVGVAETPKGASQ